MIRRRAYTLIEAVIVLSIVASMSLVAVYRFPTRSRQASAENIFWDELRNAWQERVLVAGQGSGRQVMAFSKTLNAVQFKHFGNPKAWKTMQLPATLHLVKSRDVTINRNGHAELAFVRFRSDLRPGYQIKINAEMGWGAYGITQEKV